MSEKRGLAVLFVYMVVVMYFMTKAVMEWIVADYQGVAEYLGLAMMILGLQVYSWRLLLFPHSVSIKREVTIQEGVQIDGR